MYYWAVGAKYLYMQKYTIAKCFETRLNSKWSLLCHAMMAEKQ
jgi:hypothetical protein